MAKKSGGRVFNVSVIGLSGTEREKGLAGVGKSCLCNRFMHPLADDYHTDHISVLSQSDFGGRVINNDHFLYWGETTKTDEGSDYTFHVIEQTEFVDDVSFQPFRTGRIEPYTKRCANTKVQSAEKLMYICKEQLGIETDSTYEQKLMPEGRINVDGFLCVFDVSAVQQRTLEKQVEFITSMVNNVIKTKKPLVMVTTKNDSADDRYSKEAEKLCNRKEFRVNLPLVETSAHTNVNVELAFMTLAHLIDKTKARTKIVPFSEADRARKEILNVAEEAYRNLLRSHVTDAKAVWVTWRKKFESKPDYTHYVELFGSEKARKLFRQHCKALRDEQVKKRETHFLTRLPDVLQQFLPSLNIISDRSWLACQRYIRQHPDFDQAFVEVCADENDSWKFSDFVDDYEDTRLPFDLLTSTDAETYFRNHLNALQAEHKKLELKNQFRDLLAESGHVTPGKPLSEAYVFFVGKECFNSLLEHERLQVYEAYQADLRAQARHDFQELLWEKTELFTRLNPSTRLTPSDLKDITTALEEDHRYKVLHRMEEARKVMILNHLGFIQCPSKQMCYFKDNCVDVQVSKVLAAKAIRPDILDNRLDSSDSGEKPMNLVLLGKETLATQVNKEIRHLCPDDEYRLSNSSLLFSLDYRPIDGDVTLTENSFATVDFKPHGCFCVYNSAETFKYVRASLEQTLLADLKRDQGQELQGMPIIIIQAYNHRLSKDVQCKLQDDGKQLAKKLHSEFIDIPADEKLVDGKSFYLEQIEQALHSVISHACNIPRDCIDTDSEADMRIAVCMICGDPYSLDIPLGPILGHDLCSVSSESPGIVTFETFLDFCKRKVEVTFMSYHEASMRKSQMYHGYILVYSVHRKASLATMKAFAESFYDIPVLILAVTESEGASAMFSDDQIQNLIFEGNGLADHLQGNFMTTTRTFSRQSGAYTLFFRDCWERREETESQYPNLYQEEESSPPSYYRLSIGRRPPLPPPISPMPHPQHPDLYPTAKSSTSNSQSTEDSDPQYVRPVRYIQDHSDSEHERASSASPPPNSAQSTNHYAVSPLYHPHTYQNGERLVRPSQLKHSRDVYAVWALNDPPDRHVKAASFALGTKLTSSSEEGECMTTSLYDTARVQNDEEWVDNSLYDHGDVQASGYPAKTKRLDLSKFGQVSEFLSHNLRRARHSSGSRVQAPLALPEQLEIGDYATVRSADRKDAVPENDYASVQDALPVGRFHKIRSSRKKHNKPKGLTDSDSELSSLERSDSKDLYSKVNRKPTPHKKKWKSREHHSEERLAGTSTTDRVQSNSPSDGSDGSADEGRTNRKEKKKRPSVRKRWKSSTAEKKSIPPPSTSPPMSDSDYVGSPPGRGIDDENLYEPINPRENTSNTLKFSTEDVDLEPGDGTKTKNRVRALKDPDKAKKKEEKRLREEERKRNKELKEEGKRRNREDMKRLKFKRKDGKMIGASQCSNMLEDHPPSADNPQIPLFVEKCVQYIEEEGMQAEGIYRVPGNKAQVDLLISKFHEDSAVDISTLDIQVNAVATALKGFFSELTEPLVPTHLYEQLFEAARIPQKSCKLVALRGVLKKIPSPNYEVLRFLTIHLNRVSKNSASNSMDCRNLGVCWWPTLLRLDIATLDKITEVSSICVEVVHLLVEQAGFFFYDADEV